jgi:hypothetical protein
MRTIPAALVLLLLAAPANAQRLFLSNDSQGLSCADAVVSASSTIDVYVMADLAGGVTAASFRIPTPSCAGVSLVDATVLGGFIWIGDVESGIQIATTACLTGTQALVRLQYFVATAQCCELQLLPHPQADTGQLEVFDCAFAAHVANAQPYGFVSTSAGPCGYSPPPNDPSPPDGASNVPVTFSWPDYHVAGAHAACLPLCYDTMYQLYFGTDPDPPLVWSYMAVHPALGPLDPATTYYWRIVVLNCGFLAEGPVWSFTTENATPAESKTWGAVKALYRQ